jgi:hypothetical protein
MLRLTSILLVLALAVLPAPPADDPDLAAGIVLVKDGDFEAAVLRLDAAVRRLETANATPTMVAKGYLYLGVSYLELDQEPTARGKFREVLRREPALSLDPHQFSPQVIRVFEATRQEARGPAAPASAPATIPAEQKKKRSATPILLIGGGAAAAGIAVAAGGGGSGSPATTSGPTTTTTATTSATTTTTTTPTTTQPGSACSYTITPAQVQFSKEAGSASCQVRTSAACAWTAESTQSWLHVLGSARGQGNGTIPFSVEENKDKQARSGKIRLLERKSVFCVVLQAGKNFAEGEVALAVASELTLRGGSGQLVVNGVSASFQDAGRHQLLARARNGDNRIEATVVAASGVPGTWRLDFAGPLPTGALRVLAGEVVQLTPSSVVFRLAGRSGERLVLLVQP